ncbi:MAG TPA: 5-oxoprolinase subunit PxpB [Jatrophihabitans sp.]|jgi:KipI family sensor histidine kinase inhibitor
MKIHRYGEHALLADLDDPHEVPVVRAALAALDGVTDAVAGAQTVLVVFEPGHEAAVRAVLDRGDFAAAWTGDPPRSVTIPVRYDGPDLAAVADAVGLTPDEVVDLHCRGSYVVRFCGFAPGFAYLDGLDERLHVPRRSDPRTSVPAGAVGIAGQFTGVYPRPSPGGWQLLGRTDLPLWDPAAPEPALLAPGTSVRFEAQ